MLTTLMVALLSFTLLFFSLFFLRYGVEKAERALDAGAATPAQRPAGAAREVVR